MLRNLIFCGLLIATAAPLMAHGGAYSLQSVEPISGSGGFKPGFGNGGPGGPGGQGGPGGPLIENGVVGRPGKCGLRLLGTGRTTAELRWASWWFHNKDRVLTSEAQKRNRRLVTQASQLTFRNFEATRIWIDDRDGELRRETLTALRLSLADPYFDARAASVIALGKRGGPDIRGDIESLLDDQDKRVRESSVLALGLLGEKEAVPLLIEIMNNTSSAKKKLGRRTSDILPRTRGFAAIGLGLIGARHLNDMSDTEAVSALEAAMYDHKHKAHEDLRIGPIFALGLMKSQSSIPALQKFMNDKNNRARSRGYAATSLGKIGAPSAIPDLIKGLKDKHNSVVQGSAIALGGILTPQDHKEVRLLQKMLRTGKCLVAKNYSTMSMGHIGGDANRAALFSWLKKGNNFTKTFAALSLGVSIHDKALDDDHGNLAPYLHQRFNRRKSPVERGVYALSLSLMKHESASEDIFNTLVKGGDPDMRSHLALALGLLNYKKADAHLRHLMAEGGTIDLRRNSALALSLMGDRITVNHLLEQLEDPTTPREVCGAIVKGLGYLNYTASIARLIAMTKKRGAKHAQVRAFAIAALGVLGDKDPAPLLNELSRNNNYFDRTDAVREVLSIL